MLQHLTNTQFIFLVNVSTKKTFKHLTAIKKSVFLKSRVDNEAESNNGFIQCSMSIYMNLELIKTVAFVILND